MSTETLPLLVDADVRARLKYTPLTADDWSPGFFEQLEGPDAGTKSAVDEIIVVILNGRTSKEPPSL